MKLIIETPNFNAKRTLIDFVEEKTMKLESFNDRIVDCRVFLKLDNSDTKENKVCEIKLGVPGNDLFASAQCATFEEAIQQCIASIRHKIERSKDARNKKLHEKPDFTVLEE